MAETLQPRDALRVLAVAGEHASESELQEVEELASALGVLHAVIRVLPAWEEVAQRGEFEASMQADRELTEKASFADWVISVLRSNNRPATEVVRTPIGFVETAAKVAKDMDAGMIVLMGVGAAEVGSVTELAHASERPVLLARPTGHSGGVLVATSLADNGIRVFRFGAELARRLGVKVTLAHNAVAKGAEVTSEHDAARAELETRASLIGAETGVEVEVVLSDVKSPEVAIVKLAAQGNWRLLVLGSYPRSWLTAWLIPSVSAAVVERVTASVVILPLREPEPGV
jgi:nucleotide-binding universal stress UspA family protein